MEESWQPEAFKNDYLEKLQAILDAKVKAGGKSTAKRTAKPSGNVIDLMAALEQSLKAGAGKRKPAGGKGTGRKKAG
jgi:DNA end-binding protein Ku